MRDHFRKYLKIVGTKLAARKFKGPFWAKSETRRTKMGFIPETN